MEDRELRAMLIEAGLTDVHPGVREAAHDALEAIDAGG